MLAAARCRPRTIVVHQTHHEPPRGPAVIIPPMPPPPGLRPRPRPPRPTVEPLPPWGVLEWFTVAQTFMPALLFIPGITVVRTATRIAAYLLGFAAWGAVVAGPKKGTTSGSFPAKPWLLAAIAWLILSLANPNSYSPLTAFGHVMLYVSIMSPAFWAGEAVGSPRQLRRVMTVLFLCNATSASVGLAQVFYPSRFNPPVIPIMVHEGAEQLYYESADGRKILRPCGLTDTPGAAAPAGAAAALFGLCIALRPLPLWRRGASVGLAFIGVTVIYYTQVRSALVMLGICLSSITVLLMYRGEYRSAAKLVGGGVILFAGALLMVARTIGGRVFERFGTLLDNSPVDVYTFNRGRYIYQMFESLGKYPLGYGLGWWGMVHQAFRNPLRLSPIWVEIMPQALAIDGGAPLAILYTGAVAVAMVDSVRIAMRTKDRELGFWASLVVAQNLGSVALCFSYPTFLSPTGLQFWMLAAALHAAEAQSSGAARASKARRNPPKARRTRPGLAL